MDYSPNRACTKPSFDTSIKSCSHQIRIEHQLTICPQATKRGWDIGVDRFDHLGSQRPVRYTRRQQSSKTPPIRLSEGITHKPFFHRSARRRSGLVHLRI